MVGVLTHVSGRRPDQGQSVERGPVPQHDPECGLHREPQPIDAKLFRVNQQHVDAGPFPRQQKASKVSEKGQRKVNGYAIWAKHAIT